MKHLHDHPATAVEIASLDTERVCGSCGCSLPTTAYLDEISWVCMRCADETDEDDD